jgi:hypothetical protein
MIGVRVCATKPALSAGKLGTALVGNRHHIFHQQASHTAPGMLGINENRAKHEYAAPVHRARTAYDRAVDLDDARRVRVGCPAGADHLGVAAKRRRIG